MYENDNEVSTVGILLVALVIAVLAAALGARRIGYNAGVCTVTCVDHGETYDSYSDISDNIGIVCMCSNKKVYIAKDRNQSE